jgi:hypothetical protein
MEREKDLETMTCDALLNEAEQIGKKALVEPIPEMANEASLPHRAETMRVYFTMHVNDLMDTFGSLPKNARGGQSDPQMRARIVDALEKGFEYLIQAQPSFHHAKGFQHTLSEVLEYSREVFGTIREPHKTYPERLQFTGGQIDYRLPRNYAIPQTSFSNT